MVERRLYVKKNMDETNDIWSEITYGDLVDKYLWDENKDWYVIRTRDNITASKIKLFIRNPEEYRIRYELELPEFEPQDKQHFKMWNAFDVMVSSWLTAFTDRYYIDKWYVKWDLVKSITEKIEKYKDEIMKFADVAKKAIEEKISELKTEASIAKWREKQDNITAIDVLEFLTLDQLRDIYYEVWDRVRLTPAEARDVMGMYQEYCRQPLFDREWEYVWQQYMECKFWNLKISWTLDRFSAEKQLIRDTKTSWRIENFEWDVENTFDYITQMSFYYVLAYLTHWVECDVRLDIVSTKSPYASIVYKMSKAKLKKKMLESIKPAFIALINCKETWKRPVWDRMQAIKSPYYPIMETSIMHQPIE